MRKLTIGVLAVCLAAATSALCQTPDLMITEYVEGAGNNKALEIYNGTEDVINLGAYTIERYSNGSLVAASIALSAVDLGPGDAFVIANTASDPALLAYANQTNANINFNGNDAVVLAMGGTPVDSFGRVGEDPGTSWSCADGNTINHTLRRLSSVCEGDAIVDDVFNPCTEWSFAASDVYSGLGEHIADCGTVANEASTWGGVKMLFR